MIKRANDAITLNAITGMGATATMLLGLLLLLPLSSAQQVGSFFTAIYLNGAPLPASQISCSSMNQPSYCCNSGTTCAWDDAGHVACCASGYTCQGSPYSPGASEGVYQAETQTTTVYQTPPAPYSTVGNVVPIVPVTEATVLTPAPAPEPTYTTTTVYQELSTTTTVAPIPYTTTTVYNVPHTTTTVYNAAPAPVPLTTTITQVPQEVVTAGKCAGGYTTLTDQGVGVPVTTVGCNIIFNSGGGKARGEWVEMFVLEVLGFLGMALWWR